jgi:transcriptional regulator with XRE-family HTH domain
LQTVSKGGTIQSTRAKGGKRMNIEERLSQVMLSKEINRSQLSKAANIPYTTIDGMFKKGCSNIKLSTLMKLADYFDVSIDYLVGRGTDSDLTPDELCELEKYKSFLLFKRKENEYGS